MPSQTRDVANEVNVETRNDNESEANNVDPIDLTKDTADPNESELSRGKRPAKDDEALKVLAKNRKAVRVKLEKV
ncbi:unnamed protein product [Cuscuta europaea]|uniref:Uncharacterized protein n=1 Tax=Cuscuta europaea TaxID=41803 RepID=A0A9P0YW00_CUSEU|nr:unnamed protein product [Cuscuta europaea]